jgi:hypothetical protein
MSFVAKAVKSVGKAVVSVVKGVVKAVGKVVSGVFDFVGQAFMGLFGGAPDMGDGASEASRQDGVLVQKDGSNVNVPVIYGIRKVGGIVTYSETGNDNNKYLWVAYVLGEGPIAGLDELWIDDNQFTTDIVAKLNAGEEVEVTGQPVKSPTEKYNGRCKFRFFPGKYYATPSQSPVASLIKQSLFATAPEFTNQMVYNGLAVLFARYEWKKVESQADSDNNPFSGGIPKIQTVLHGRLVEPLATTYFDKLGKVLAEITQVLTGQSDTNWFDSWPTTPYNRNDGRWSNNPAECLFDYLRNPQYGKGLKIEDFDRSTWIKAADKCNTPVEYYAGKQGPILTCNAVVDTGQSLFNNVKTLLTGFRAYMPYIQGKYKLKIEDAGNVDDILSGVATIVQQVTLDQIVGDITYTGIDKTSKYNQVVVTYVEPAQKWTTQQVVYPSTEAQRQVYITEDGGRENKAEVTFGTITNSSIAQDMARLIFNKSRFQETCSFKMSAQGFELEPGDNITIKGNLLDLTDTPWRVISTKINNDYTVDVGCVRNPDNVILDNGTVGSFYPYGRYLEPDIIRPLYVPKGNLIYWPGVGGTDWGLLPPDNPPFPAGTTTVPEGSIPPVNPLVDGGGNGSGSGASNGSAVPAVKQPTAVLTKNYDDIVTFTAATFNTTNNTWTVTFNVPDTVSDYGGLMIWIQPSNIVDPNTWSPLPTLSNGSRNFTFNATSATTVAYNILTRIKYQGGDITSTRAGRCTLSRQVGGLYNARGETYNFGSISATNDSFVNLDAEINLVSAVINSGTAPKTVTFNLNERVGRVAGSTSMDAAILYYKPEASAGYKQFAYTLPTTYAANQTFTFTLQDFGTTTAIYDIILRWRFKNGQLGNNIYKDKLNVSSSGTVQGNNLQFLANTQSFPVAVASATNATAVPSVTSITGSSGIMSIYIADPSLAPTSMTDWLGARVEIATTTLYSVSEYTRYDCVLNAEIAPAFGGGYIITIYNRYFAAQANYNIVITLSYLNSGNTAYSSKAIKLSGKFFGSAGGTVNQLGNFTRNSQTTYELLKGDGGTTVAVPTGQSVVVPSGLIDVLVPVGSTSVSDAVRVSTLQVNFVLPTGASHIRVYRSHADGHVDFTDVSTSGTRFRYSRNSTVFNGVPHVESDIFKQTIYIRVRATGGTLSSRVLKIIPQWSARQQASSVDIMGTLFDSDLNNLDLTDSKNSALASALNSAVQTSTYQIRYATREGWQQGTIT